MRYFATVSKSSTNAHVQDKVLASNPITEVCTLWVWGVGTEAEACMEKWAGSCIQAYLALQILLFFFFFFN